MYLHKKPLKYAGGLKNLLGHFTKNMFEIGLVTKRNFLERQQMFLFAKIQSVFFSKLGLITRVVTALNPVKGCLDLTDLIPTSFGLRVNTLDFQNIHFCP